MFVVCKLSVTVRWPMSDNRARYASKWSSAENKFSLALGWKGRLARLFGRFARKNSTYRRLNWKKERASTERLSVTLNEASKVPVLGRCSASQEGLKLTPVRYFAERLGPNSSSFRWEKKRLEHTAISQHMQLEYRLSADSCATASSVSCFDTDGN